MLLVALRTGAVASAWSSSFWYAFQRVNEWFTTGILTVALLLTVVSLITYLFSFGRIFARQQA
jgi:ABC-type maltose transport system permease subunit